MMPTVLITMIKMVTKSLAFNVLAFNKTGKSCRYLNNTVPDKTQTFYATGNAFELTEALCDLPESVLTSTNSSIKNIDVKNNAISDLSHTFTGNI